MANKLNTKNKICPICGKNFKPARSTTLACSKQCSNKYKYKLNKEKYICDYCGKEYIANKYNNSRKEKNYCSKDCQIKDYWEENRLEHKKINNVECKKCSTCKEWLSLDSFNKDNNKWDNISNVCVNCYNKYVRNVWSKTTKGIVSRKVSKLRRRIREQLAGKILSKTITHVMNENIEEFGQLTCIYCKTACKDSWHLEHKIPLSRGGNNNITNLAISCPKCNLKKGVKTEQEFRQITDIEILDGIEQ